MSGVKGQCAGCASTWSSRWRVASGKAHLYPLTPNGRHGLPFASGGDFCNFCYNSDKAPKSKHGEDILRSRDINRCAPPGARDSTSSSKDMDTSVINPVAPRASALPYPAVASVSMDTSAHGGSSTSRSALQPVTVKLCACGDTTMDGVVSKCLPCFQILPDIHKLDHPDRLRYSICMLINHAAEGVSNLT